MSTAVSLETVLSDAGVISQIPMNRIMVISSGRSNLIDCNTWGSIEFVHTRQTPDSLIKQLHYDRTSKTVKDIACDERITQLLITLYGRQAFAFQTLNFRYGSQLATHSDAMHFHSAPERYMCGVWVALEDVHFDTGPLHYYLGSHKLPTYDCRQLGWLYCGRKGLG